MKLIRAHSIKHPIHYASVDDEDFEFLNKYRWSLSKHNDLSYAHRSMKIIGSKKRICVSLHREVLGLKHGDKRQVDHKDRNGLNCQKHNLRITTASQNAANQRKQIAKTSSIYKGVCWCKSRKRWVALIRINGKRKSLGRFKKEIDAAIAYNKKAEEVFGEFALVNIL